jgi:hypothetical protein
MARMMWLLRMIVIVKRYIYQMCLKNHLQILLYTLCYCTSLLKWHPFGWDVQVAHPVCCIWESIREFPWDGPELHSQRIFSSGGWRCPRHGKTPWEVLTLMMPRMSASFSWPDFLSTVAENLCERVYLAGQAFKVRCAILAIVQQALDHPWLARISGIIRAITKKT